MISEFKPLRRASLSDQVADQIREAIFRGDYAPGDLLPTERQLCELFDVGRTSVREALRTLEAQGLVSGGKGSPVTRTVTAPAIAGPLRDGLLNLLRLRRVSLDDLVELRCALESGALELAASSPTPGGLEDAREALASMEDPKIDLDGFNAADVQFHVSLVKTSGNEAMESVMLAARDAIPEHLLAALRTQQNVRRTIRKLTSEHAEILRAVEGGDGELASQLVRDHIRGFYRSVIRPGRNRIPSVKRD